MIAAMVLPVSMMLMLILLSVIGTARAFRVYGTADENKSFVPYERGFVGDLLDPATPSQDIVNQGYETHAVSTPQSCPGMVGPMDDGKFYCLGKEYGFCDRRSGKCSSTHIRVGDLCYPKKLCPNDCSQAGVCDHLTGVCSCREHREGADCSDLICSKYDKHCTRCNDDRCTACIEGYNSDATNPFGSQCNPCSRFDPRCIDCNSTACLTCIDLLLLSSRRSGKRDHDPDLPEDELLRELSTVVPFGSQRSNAFDEAEHYFVVEPSLSPLNESTYSCDQGLALDPSQTCHPIKTSNVVCGNYGLISFVSPEYEVMEDGGHIRLSIVRSGGGVGTAVVSYRVEHVTTDDNDVTPTASYTTNQTLTFHPGQVQQSFLIAINDDRVKEPNESFLVCLSITSGLATLGTQYRTIVTIIDDDDTRTCSNKSQVQSAGGTGHRRSIAGEAAYFTIEAFSCLGSKQDLGGDEFKVIASAFEPEGAPMPSSARANGNCVDEGGGSYECELVVEKAGKYNVEVYQLIPGGLLGHYHTSAFLTPTTLEKSRIDSVLNFTWGEGRLTNVGTDFVSVCWTGFVMPLYSEVYTFWLDVDDSVRFWIDGVLLIDEWGASSSGLFSANHSLEAGVTFEVRIEYRELTGNATARLLWSSPQTPLEIIPSSALFYKEHLKGSPYTFTVVAAQASASKSKASGVGLRRGVAGKEHLFTIESRDVYGNFRGDFDAGFDGSPAFDEQDLPTVRERDGFFGIASLVGNDGGGVGATAVPVVITYNPDSRLFEGLWTPTKSGTYSLNVTLSSELIGSNMAGTHILGSPFTIETTPAVTFARESIVYGGNGNCFSPAEASCSGLRNGLAGNQSVFFVRSLDEYRNRRDAGTTGDEWSVTLHSDNGNAYLYGETVHEGGGVYRASVVPTTSGKNMLSVTLNGVHAKGSPYIMNVRHGYAHGPSCTLLTDLDSTEIVATLTNRLVVQAYDAYGNLLKSNSDPYGIQIEVESTDPTGEVSSSPVISIGGGQYVIVFAPVLAGRHRLSIKVNELEIKGSPFTINVVPGNFAGSRSIAFGTGTISATAGVEGVFIIQSRDENGNNKTTDDGSFSITLDMKMLPRRPVQYDTLTAVDWGSDAMVLGHCHYIGDGRYAVSYLATVSGLYSMAVRALSTDEESEHIIGSPFEVHIAPGATSAAHSTVAGSGTREGVAGLLAPVRVYARDEHGNFILDSTDYFRLFLMNLAGGPYAAQVDATTSFGSHYALDYLTSRAGHHELEVTLDSPGGLWGSYYSSLDFDVQHLAFVTHDEEIDKMWGLNTPSFDSDEESISECVPHTSLRPEECSTSSLSTENFAVEWTGKVRSDHDEEHAFIVECDEGGSSQIYVNGVEIMAWGDCYHARQSSVVLYSSESVDIAIRYRHRRGDAFFVLKWSSVSIGSAVIVPKANLYRELLVGGTTYQPLISPSSLSPAMTTAVGRSLTQAVAGTKQSLFVECRDAFSNLLLSCEGAHISVLGSIPSGTHGPSFEGIVVDINESGTLVEYNPTTSGTHSLSVEVYVAGSSDRHIKGSPFLLHVVPGTIDPRTSHLQGETTVEATAGREMKLEMRANDKHGNLAASGGDIVTCVYLQDENENECAVSDARNGTYFITFTPFQTGEHRLGVRVGDENEDILDSPFQVTVNPAGANASRTHVVSGEASKSTRMVEYNGTVWTFAGTIGHRREFTVVVKDSYGNAVSGGNKFRARIRGETNILHDETQLDIVDKGDGSYVFSYSVSLPGKYEVDVLLASEENGLAGRYFMNRYLKGTPMLMRIDHAPDFNVAYPAKSIGSAEWSGFVNFPTSGETKFYLELASTSGNDGAMSLWVDDSLVVDTSESGVAEGTFVGKTDSLYAIRIEAQNVDHTASIRLLWSSRRSQRHVVPSKHLFTSVQPIMGSPFELTVIGER